MGKASKASMEYDRGAKCPTCGVPTRILRPKFRRCQNGHTYVKKSDS